MNVSVRNLTKQFKHSIAVNDLSFDIQRGETFALLGPNGSGKTTTLKCIAGLTVPTCGQILVGGFDVWRNSREAKRLMSFLPQRLNFSENLTGREVLKFYCDLRRLPAKRIDETLNTPNFHFNGFFEKSVGQYSGGMTQRLGIAVACLPDAPVLVLDEPTVSLDPSGAIEFREFLARLKGQGKTIVFSSHVLADIEKVADRVAVMVNGRLVTVQSIAALRDELLLEARLRITLRTLDPQLIEIAKHAGATEVTVEGNSFLLKCRAEDRLRILNRIKAAGGLIETFGTEELSLEDMYMKYAKEEAV